MVEKNLYMDGGPVYGHSALGLFGEAQCTSSKKPLAISWISCRLDRYTLDSSPAGLCGGSFLNSQERMGQGRCCWIQPERTGAGTVALEMSSGKITSGR